jgi:hypothetical protein
MPSEFCIRKNMNNRFCGYAWAVLTVICAVVPASGLAEEYFLFTSSRGNGEEGLHLAWSTNGYHWQALNHDRPFLKPDVGAYKIMRDPCLAEGPDGAFHMVWTSGWTADKGKARWLIFWSSTIPGKFAASDNTGDDGYNHRFYYTTTVDFKAFTESRLLYNPGFNAIDATLFQAGGKFYLFFTSVRFNLNEGQYSIDEMGLRRFS